MKLLGNATGRSEAHTGLPQGRHLLTHEVPTRKQNKTKKKLELLNFPKEVFRESNFESIYSPFLFVQ